MVALVLLTVLSASCGGKDEAHRCVKGSGSMPDLMRVAEYTCACDSDPMDAMWEINLESFVGYSATSVVDAAEAAGLYWGLGTRDIDVLVNSSATTREVDSSDGHWVIMMYESPDGTVDSGDGAAWYTCVGEENDSSDCDIVLLEETESGIDLVWDFGGGDPASGAASGTFVLAHEMGHVLGISHMATDGTSTAAELIDEDTEEPLSVMSNAWGTGIDLGDGIHELDDQALMYIYAD